jgi:hypothetical protein
MIATRANRLAMLDPAPDLNLLPERWAGLTVSWHHAGPDLITVVGPVGDMGEAGEVFAEVLTRAPHLDGSSPHLAVGVFGINPDIGAHGAVWISGEAYTLDWDDDCIAIAGQDCQEPGA